MFNWQKAHSIQAPTLVIQLNSQWARRNYPLRAVHRNPLSHQIAVIPTLPRLGMWRLAKAVLNQGAVNQAVMNHAAMNLGTQALLTEAL